MASQNDINVLRQLGNEYAKIANMPIQRERVGLWKKLNGLKPERPMVMIDQLPINELASPGDGLLDIKCEDDFLRSVEFSMRFDMLRWKNYGGDMVLLPQVRCPLPVLVKGGYLGLGKTKYLKSDRESSISSQQYEDMLKDEADLEKVTDPVVIFDAKKADDRMALLNEIFAGIMDVTADKTVMLCNVWDTVNTLRSISAILIDMYDRPDFLHKVIDRMFRVYRSIYEQYGKLDLLDLYPRTVHCAGAFTDELPKEGFAGKVRFCDTWIYTMAQMFSTVSPQMDKEYQLDYVEKYFGDAGLIYYGCCEPLHDRIHLIMKLKNVRKVSVSPWADLRRSAEQLGSGAVLSRKPNPAFLAFDIFDESLVRKELSETIAVCREYNTPCELILKDVSTLKYKPERLKRWNEIAMELVTS